MRRRFNQNILPKYPPEKGQFQPTPKYKTKFQKWFHLMLQENELPLKDFCRLTGLNYETAHCWRYRVEPNNISRKALSRGMEKIGLGTYTDNLRLIQSLCKRK